MSAGPWSPEQMRLLCDGVLRRGVRRYRKALDYLGDRGTASARRLRRELRAMESELTRRQRAPSIGAGERERRFRMEDRTQAGEAGEPGASVRRLVPLLGSGSPKVVSVLDGRGVVRRQSAAVKWLLGFDAQTLVGKPLQWFLCPASRPRAADALARMEHEEEKVDDWQLEFRTASRGTFWLEGMAWNFLRDERLNGILVHWREWVA